MIDGEAVQHVTMEDIIHARIATTQDTLLVINGKTVSPYAMWSRILCILSFAIE